MKNAMLRVAGSVALAWGCHRDAPDETADTGSPDHAGQVCGAPADCYLDVEGISGSVECLDRVRDGYCTHECTQDDDCCAVEGECISEWPQVCSPFESTGQMLCFLSCEPSDVEAAGAPDDQTFCQHEANAAFICRSSGGGSNNRKVCVPGDCGVGAACAEPADCPADLACLTEPAGGYCGVADCGSNADCPSDSACIEYGGGTLCARRCEGDPDCGFCRPPDVAAVCRTDVTYVDASTSFAVCVPA
jgi:hypothetical protein